MRCNLRVTRKAFAFLTILTLSVVWSKPGTAQLQEPPPFSDQQAQEVQQLKAKLQQLEQMMDEVKGKLNDLEAQPAAAAEASDGGPNNTLVSAVTSFDTYPTTHASGALAGAPPFGKQADQKKPGSESTMDIDRKSVV